MKRSLVLVLLVFMPGAARHSANLQVSNQAGEQRAAEEAADRVMRRFYDTLDFKAVYDDLYVPEPFKSIEVRWTIRGFVWQSSADAKRGELPKTIAIDFSAMERAYIARQNFEFLLSAIMFTHRDEDLTKFKTEFAELYQALQRERIKPILTSEQLDATFTARLDQLDNLLRKYVDAKSFDTPPYRSALLSVEESREEESPRLRELFQLDATRKIFVVRRERNYLYFIWVNGQMRMLSSTPRIQD
jgi:hypothetical protein